MKSPKIIHSLKANTMENLPPITLKRRIEVIMLALEKLEECCEADLCHLAFIDDNKSLQNKYLEAVAILTDLRIIYRGYEAYINK